MVFVRLAGGDCGANEYHDAGHVSMFLRVGVAAFAQAKSHCDAMAIYFGWHIRTDSGPLDDAELPRLWPADAASRQLWSGAMDRQSSRRRRSSSIPERFPLDRSHGLQPVGRTPLYG